VDLYRGSGWRQLCSAVTLGSGRVPGELAGWGGAEPVVYLGAGRPCGDPPAAGPVPHGGQDPHAVVVRSSNDRPHCPSIALTPLIRERGVRGSGDGEGRVCTQLTNCSKIL